MSFAVRQIRPSCGPYHFLDAWLSVDYLIAMILSFFFCKNENNDKYHTDLLWGLTKNTYVKASRI